MEKMLVEKLRQDYPTYMPVSLAAQMLGVSGRQLSRLVTEGRQPFSDIGANVGIGQRYVRIYTERLIAYLSGEPGYD